MSRALSTKENSIRMREWRAKNIQHSREYQNQYKRRKRQMVYDYYGGKCACCGETQFEFLSIDHINGGGTQHRIKEKIRGTGMIDWLIRKGLPEGFQVLCHNCNQAKGYYGKCPHALLGNK